MSPGHEEIRDKLPEYISSGDIPGDVREHLRTCDECSREAFLLEELNSVQVPEPGGLFFETLPEKIRASVRPAKKGFLFRFVPVFIMIALVVTAGYIYHITNLPLADEELFTDPLAFESLDLSGLSEDDIPSISVDIEDDEIYPGNEASLYSELASLSSEEIEDLYNTLETKNQNGGVL